MGDADLNKAWNQLQDKLAKSGRSAMVILPPQDVKYTQHSPPPDVVEAARQTMKRFGELDGEAWKDIQAVCEWVLSHKAIDK